MKYIHGATLFLSADCEAQKLCPLGIDLNSFIVRHYLYSVLLSTKVIIPAGCYYQSGYTQRLLYQYESLFLPYKDHPPLSELSIGEDRDSFAEDAMIKKSWFPEEYGYTDDMEIDALTRRIDNISPTIRSGKMRVRLTANIANDINGSSKVKEILNQELESNQRTEDLVKPLQKVIEVQEYAILPTYIQIEMERHGLETNYGQKRWLDFILFKNYAKSCEEAYQSYCNNPLSIFYDDCFRRIYPFQLDYRDTNLFDQFVKLFPFPQLDRLNRMNIKEIMTLKNSDRFRIYLNNYKAVVQTLKNELQATVFDTTFPYGTFQDTILQQKGKEYHYFRTQLITNVAESMTLYKILKNPFLRVGRFQTWMSHQDTELPTIKILSCIKDKKNGILKAYVNELFEQSKTIFQNERKAMKKNFSINFGGHTEQNIDSRNKSLLQDNHLSCIMQKDFEDIDQNAFENFIKELNKDRNPDVLEAKKAILAVMNARYASSPDEYEDFLDTWREKKIGFSERAKSVLQIASQTAGIASFILKLLGV